MTWFYNYLSGDRKSVVLFVSMYVVALEQDTKICQCQLKQWESFFSGGYAEKNKVQGEMVRVGVFLKKRREREGGIITTLLVRLGGEFFFRS